MNPTQCEIPKSEEKTVSCPKMGNSTTSNLMSTSMLEDVSHFSNNDTEAEAMSFIVLGKDSLDAIQASSLASYVDIQQKSMSIVCLSQFYIILIVSFSVCVYNYFRIMVRIYFFIGL